MALLDARGFREEDFARSHPGGALGRKLLTLVRDVMRGGDAVPKVDRDTPFVAMMREMTSKGLGATAVVGERDRVVGIFTDGDLRRLVEKGSDLRALVAGDVIAIEPGAYRIGFGGCRIEDCVLVTEDGCEVLSNFPHDLVIDV